MVLVEWAPITFTASFGHDIILCVKMQPKGNHAHVDCNVMLFHHLSHVHTYLRMYVHYMPTKLAGHPLKAILTDLLSQRDFQLSEVAMAQSKV